MDQNLPRVSGQFQLSVPNPVLPGILPVSSQNGVRSGLLSKKAQPATIFGATFAGRKLKISSPTSRSKTFFLQHPLSTP